MQSPLVVLFLPFSSQLFLCQTNFCDMTQLSIISKHNRSNRPTDLKWVSSETVTGQLCKVKRLANSFTGFKYKVTLGRGHPESALRTSAGKKGLLGGKNQQKLQQCDKDQGYF